LTCTILRSNQWIYPHFLSLFPGTAGSNSLLLLAFSEACPYLRWIEMAQFVSTDSQKEVEIPSWLASYSSISISYRSLASHIPEKQGELLYKS
jgi:hypothetical protein